MDLSKDKNKCHDPALQGACAWQFEPTDYDSTGGKAAAGDLPNAPPPSGPDPSKVKNLNLPDSSAGSHGGGNPYVVNDATGPCFPAYNPVDPALNRVPGTDVTCGSPEDLKKNKKCSVDSVVGCQLKCVLGSDNMYHPPDDFTKNLPQLQKAYPHLFMSEFQGATVTGADDKGNQTETPVPANSSKTLFFCNPSPNLPPKIILKMFSLIRSVVGRRSVLSPIFLTGLSCIPLNFPAIILMFLTVFLDQN